MNSRNLVRVAAGGLLALSVCGVACAAGPVETEAITQGDETTAKESLAVDIPGVMETLRQFQEHFFGLPEVQQLAYSVDVVTSQNILIGHTLSGEGFVAQIVSSLPLELNTWLFPDAIDDATNIVVSVDVCDITLASSLQTSDSTIILIRYMTPDGLDHVMVPVSNDIWNYVVLSDPPSGAVEAQAAYGAWRCAVNGLIFSATMTGCFACIGGCPFPPNPVACGCAVEKCAAGPCQS